LTSSQPSIEFRSLEERRLFWRELGLRSFYHFVKVFGAPVKQGAIITKEIHKPLCDFVQDPAVKRKGILMPRDWRKSTVFTKWRAIWKYLRDNEERILIAAETEKIGSNMLDAIEKMLIYNELLRWCYPELKRIDKTWTAKNKWSGIECMLPRTGIFSEPTITVIGTGAAAQSRHFTTIMCDDLVGKAAMESPVILETTLRWFDNAKELLTDPVNDEIQITGTAWAVGDFTDYVREVYPEFQWRIVPALKVSEEKITQAVRGQRHVVFVQHPTQDINESNWPEQFPTKHYIEMQANPEEEKKFWAQHMNMPSSATGVNTFKEEWIRWYHIEVRDEDTYIVCDDDKEEFKLRDIPLYGAIDPGGFTDIGVKKGSRCAIVIAGQPPNSVKKFVLFTWAKKVLSPANLMDVVFKASEEWRVRNWGIEVVGAQMYIMRDLREEAERRKKRISLTELPRDVGADAKDLRIDSLINGFYHGQFYLSVVGQSNLKAEIISHPAGITNDLVDCLSFLNVGRFSTLRKDRFAGVNSDRYKKILEARRNSVSI
jgi:hypothetical protein